MGRDEADFARAGAEYAVSKEGTGGIVAATVIRTTRDVPVWRLWDSCKDNHTGQWWTIEQPSGTRDAYRRRFEVCASWSALDRVRRCTIRAGAVAVIGTGQSAFCEEGVFYPQNEQDYQLFLVHPEEVVVACVDYAECPDDIAMTCDAAARSCGR